MLWVLVVSIFDVPRNLIQLFDLPFRYYFGGNPPLLFAFVFVVILFNLIFVKKYYKLIVPLSKVDMIFAATLLMWFVLYLYHMDFMGGGWQAWYGANLITTNLWVLMSLYCIVSINKFRDIGHALVKITIKMWAIFVIMFLLLVLLNYFNAIDFDNRLESNNGIAMIVVFNMLLLMYVDKSPNYKKTFYMIAFCWFVWYSQSKGAMVVAFLFIIYKVYVEYVVSRIIINSLFISLVFVVFYEYRDIVGVINNYFFGFDVLSDHIEHTQAYGLDGGQVSVVSRINSSALLLKEFFAAPFFGVGYNNSVDIRSFGYISHTYYLFPLSSYGLVGVIPYAFLLYYIYSRAVKNDRVFAKASILFCISMFSFLNDMHAWMSILFFLLLHIRAPRKTSRYSYHLIE